MVRTAAKVSRHRLAECKGPTTEIKDPWLLAEAQDEGFGGGDGNLKSESINPNGRVIATWAFHSLPVYSPQITT